MQHRGYTVPLYFIDFWCNGSTNDFGSFSIGSSPVESTIRILEIENVGLEAAIHLKSVKYFEMF